MRNNNSVGGHRIRPSSPIQAELAAAGVAVLGQFNDGMDRLNRERDLTNTQQSFLQNLSPESNLARMHSNLNHITNTLWTLALNKQNSLARGEDEGVYTTRQLGQRLIECSRSWEEFKNRLDQQINR